MISYNNTPHIGQLFVVGPASYSWLGQHIRIRGWAGTHMKPKPDNGSYVQRQTLTAAKSTKSMLGEGIREYEHEVVM